MLLRTLALSLPVICLWGPLPPVMGQQGQQPATQLATPDPASEITAAIESFLNAFNQGDAEGLAAHWAEDGVYESRTSGEQVAGRASMLQQYQQMFAGETGPKLALVTDSIEFVSPNVALEKGRATVTGPDDHVIQSAYSVVYVRHNGRWLIDRVTEQDLVFEVNHADKLRDLEWMIGQWGQELDGTAVELNCNWTKKQNFISLAFKVTRDGEVQTSGLQIIGWDPAHEQIRSWLFDSEGGFVSGTWTEDEGKWVIQSVATLADGGQGSYTSVLHPRGDGTCSWQKTNQIIDGELLPNGNQVVLQRR